MNVEQGMQVTDLLGLARRRGKLIAIIAGAVILAAFWISMALPNLYTSSATILVEPQSVDEDLVNSGVRESDLNERLGLMTAEILSRVRLSKIIDKFNLYEDESLYLERSEVIDLMRAYIGVEPVLSELESGNPRNREISFNTFRIVYRNEKSTVARDVAQQVANDFINANIEARTEVTAKSLSFMQDEIESLSNQLTKVEKAVSEVKEANPGSLPDDVASNQRMLQFSMNDLRDAQRIFDAATSDASFWRGQAISATTVGATNDLTSPVHRLRSLEIELGSLNARGYTKKHPDVLRVESEIAMLQEQFSSRGEDGDESPKSISQQNAISEQHRAELRAKAAEEDIERLRIVVADLEAKIAATPAVAELLDGLSRQYDHLYRSYQDFSNRLQQAGVQADMERRQLGERFRILEPAFAEPEPSSPNRIVLLILGTVLALVIGCGAGLFAEMADTSVHTTNDLRTAIGIPVLVSVPNIMLESDRVARSRRIIRESIAAIVVVFVCLSGGIATYFFVNGGGGNDDSALEEPVPSDTSARIDLGAGLG